MVEKNSTTGRSATDRSKKVVVLGASGLLGAQVAQTFLNSGFQVKAVTHKELDITKGLDVAVWLERLHPDIVINCAALSNVDFCEKNPELAFAVNAQGVKNICLPLEENGGKLIHISTDYVFDGKKREPYMESDAVNPLSQYAKSKLKGESYVQIFLPDALIVRVQWLYGENGKSFASQLIRNVTQRTHLGPYQLLKDRVGCPTDVCDVANTLVQLAQRDAKGMIHVSSRGACNWAEFGKAVFEFNGVAQNIEIVKDCDLKRPAPRPPYSVLGSERLGPEFSVTMPMWHESLSKVVLRIKNK